MSMSFLNVFLMTSQVCIHFAQAAFAFLYDLRQQYLVKVLLFFVSESHLALYWYEAVWEAVVLIKNFPEIL